MRKTSIVKPLFLLCAAVLLLNILAGCSLLQEGMPFEKTLRQYAGALASGNYEEVEPYVTASCYGQDGYQQAEEADRKAAMLVFRQMQYVETTDAQLFDNTINAQVTFSVLDFSKAFAAVKPALKEAVKQAAAQQETDEAKMNAQLMLMLEEACKQEGAATQTQTLPIELKKENGTWRISDDSHLRDRLKEGFEKAFTEVASTVATEVREELQNNGGTPQGWDLETGGANLFEDGNRFSLAVGGEEKKLPFALKELGEITIAQEDLTHDVEAGYYYEVPFYLGKKYAGIVFLYNNSEHTMKLQDCLVGGVSLDADNVDPQFRLPEDIGFGSTVEEVQNAFGPPTSVDYATDSEYCTYIYTKADFQEVQITFADGKTVSHYVIQYFVL